MTERQLEDGEALILSVLLKRANDWNGGPVNLSALRVCDMDDGGMGSLRFVSGKNHPRYGRTVAEGWFKDLDGVPVALALFVDRDEDLFELDSWKVDFTPRLRLPQDETEVRDGPPSGN
ncbi:hypothetical protein SAMN04487912_104347 [Arthrobacter sp. cf158]|uniref:DUF6984 family protein n=1 Tax=Arthrobacter sp. cf158 TaxID=1761744 RepID=UPI00089B5DB7|nr:hypothetical protein [Arthrobacter sp. cf158]SDW75986.1 hypothetical protein SAMN04487912_104347 [Arthrobacter sp. cf158]